MSSKVATARPFVAAGVGGSLALVGALLTWLFYARYLKHADCIAAAQSSCIVEYPDGSIDNLTSGGFVWGLLAAPIWLAALLFLVRVWRA
jgi:hypothetical protein